MADVTMRSNDLSSAHWMKELASLPPNNKSFYRVKGLFGAEDIWQNPIKWE